MVCEHYDVCGIRMGRDKLIEKGILKKSYKALGSMYHRCENTDGKNCDHYNDPHPKYSQANVVVDDEYWEID